MTVHMDIIDENQRKKHSESSKSTDKPLRDKEHDGVYTRCVWCGGENYGPNVLPYSKGESGCHQCGKKLPKEYVCLQIK
jgi:hypothetical protein